MSVKGKVVKTAAVTVGKVALKAADTFANNLGGKGADAVVGKLESKKAMVRIPSGAESYYHRNYDEVKRELEAYGFSNITLVERKDLVIGFMNRNGSIEEISIDGKANFKKNAKFRSDARVVIIYHTFKKKK